MTDEIKRAERAKHLLEDPLLKKAMDECRKEIIYTWQSTPARDKEAREWLWMLHQASLKFERALLGYIDSGKIVDMTQKQSLLDKFR